MPALYPYNYGPVLLKLDDVNLSYDGRPILRGVSAEIKKIVRPGQVQGQVVGILGPSGMGKCLAKGTQVLMFDGTIKLVEDVIIGDRLMGPDSKPRKVLALGNGYDEMFTVKPVKGESYTVNSEHILALHMQTRKADFKTEIPVKDFVKKSKWFKQQARGYRTGVEFKAKHVPLSPYFLGLWLGDGDSAGSAITTADAEIVCYLYSFAAGMGATITENIYPDRCPNYRVHNKWKRQDSLLRKLRSLDILKNKHVPLLYKANSRDVRLQILAGLLDSDGEYTSGCFGFSSKIKQLADDVCYLSRSLGLAAYCRKATGRWKHNGITKEGTYYAVIISGNLDEIPTIIPRKRARPRRQIKDVLHTGISVSSEGKGQYFGFQLDGDGLFLLGDFTVTHNTQLFRIISGLNTPTSGQVFLNHNAAPGAAPDLKPVQTGEVGVVAQSYPLFPHRTILGNLMLAARNHPDAQAKVEAMLEGFELADKRNLYPAQLSGGQRQRIAIIQQILCSEHFLLMDEPFSGLDIIMEEKTLQLVLKVANMNDLNTVIVVTHDVSAAAAVSDHIWMLGRDKDANGQAIPGARIQKNYDLINEGLCWEQWQGSAVTRPAMSEFIRQVKADFLQL